MPKGWISTEKLNWNAKTNTFVGEASELGINNFDNSYIIWNPKTKGSVYVGFDKHDKNGEGIASSLYISHQGYKLLIIND